MEELTEKQKMQARLDRMQADLEETIQAGDESLGQHVMYLRSAVRELKEIIESYGNS